MRCYRCSGRKKLFKINNCYSLTDTGGVEVTCPMCNGTGNIVPLETKIAELKTKNESDRNGIADDKKKNTRDERTVDFVDEQHKSKLDAKKVSNKKGR
jgi:hypothetical protein